MTHDSKSKGNQPVEVNCVWGHLCTLSSIDQERNNISLFNIIEQFNFPAKIFEEGIRQDKKIAIMQVNYEVVLHFRKIVSIDVSKSLNIEVRLSLIDPAGRSLQENLNQLSFPSGVKRMRMRLRMGAFSLSTEGDYVYRVDIKESPDKEFVTVLNIPVEVVSKKS